jgi:hypothetical protein
MPKARKSRVTVTKINAKAARPGWGAKDAVAGESARRDSSP